MAIALVSVPAFSWPTVTQKMPSVKCRRILLVASDGVGEDGLAGPAHAANGQGRLMGVR